MRNFILLLAMLVFTAPATAGNIGEVRSIKHWRSAYERNAKFQKVEYHYTPWCIYCPRQTAIIEDLARENPHVLFVKVNGDFLRRPGVTSFPTVLVAGRTFVGLTPKATIQALLKPKQPKTQPRRTGS